MKICKDCEHWNPEGIKEDIETKKVGYCENPEFVYDTKFQTFKSVLILGDRKFIMITSSVFGCISFLNKKNTNA
jgi:hypothetical protein